jgi:hypothetical protein
MIALKAVAAEVGHDLGLRRGFDAVDEGAEDL